MSQDERPRDADDALDAPTATHGLLPGTRSSPGRVAAHPLGRRHHPPDAAGAFLNLPDDLREALLLIHGLGLPVQTAADLCGCSPDRLEARLGAAREALWAVASQERPASAGSDRGPVFASFDADPDGPGVASPSQPG